jgi:hypothetical protein
MVNKRLRTARCRLERAAAATLLGRVVNLTGIGICKLCEINGLRYIPPIAAEAR